MKGLGIIFVLFALAAAPAFHPFKLSPQDMKAASADEVVLAAQSAAHLYQEATGAASPSGLDTDLQSIRKQLTRSTGTFRSINGLNLRNSLESPHLSLSFNSSFAQIMKVEIYDFSGKRVLSWNETLCQGNNRITFDKKYIASGIYFLTATTPDGKMVRKFCAV